MKPILEFILIMSCTGLVFIVAFWILLEMRWIRRQKDLEKIFASLVDYPPIKQERRIPFD